MAYRLDAGARAGEKAPQGIFYGSQEHVSGLLATANPRRIKAAHRRRRRSASGPSVQRYYDPSIGRFLSVDPVSATSIGGNFNRYWYAANNPYKFTDPDGRQALCGEGREKRCKAIIKVNPSSGAGNKKSATNQQRSAIASISYRQARTGANDKENWVFMNDEGEVIEKTQQGCIGDDVCTIDTSQLPPGTTLAGHVHIYPNRERLRNEVKLRREFPGSGDGDVLSHGLLGAVFMPSGARYLIEGDPPRAIYMGGGNSAFGEYVEDTWFPGMSDSEILDAVRVFMQSERGR